MDGIDHRLDLGFRLWRCFIKRAIRTDFVAEWDMNVKAGFCSHKYITLQVMMMVLIVFDQKELSDKTNNN